MICSFKIGEEIVTLSENYTIKQYNNITIAILNDWTPFTSHITRGKIYKVVESRRLYDNLAILNDIGANIQPDWSCFMTVKEYRKIKLKKLSNNLVV
jgi:hypothetical protein